MRNFLEKFDWYQVYKAGRSEGETRLQAFMLSQLYGPLDPLVMLLLLFISLLGVFNSKTADKLMDKVFNAQRKGA